MSAILGTARAFFDACETGKGWEACQAYCHADATFAAQTEALAGVSTLAAYCDWMQGMYTPIPDGRYELKFFAADEADETVAAVAVFHGTQTGPGGPVPPTGKRASADYVYHMEFADGRVRHMTKIWNDAFTMKQLGWA
jgi:predicted ester cyclase